MNQFNLKETILQRNITSEKGKQTNNTLNTVTYLKVPLFTENVVFCTPNELSIKILPRVAEIYLEI